MSKEIYKEIQYAKWVCCGFLFSLVIMISGVVYVAIVLDIPTPIFIIICFLFLLFLGPLVLFLTCLTWFTGFFSDLSDLIAKIYLSFLVASLATLPVVSDISYTCFGSWGAVFIGMVVYAGLILILRALLTLFVANQI